MPLNFISSLKVADESIRYTYSIAYSRLVTFFPRELKIRHMKADC